MSEKHFTCVNCLGDLQTRVAVTYDPFDKQVFGEVMLKENYEQLYQSELHFIEITCHRCGSPKVHMEDILLLSNVGDILIRDNVVSGDGYKENQIIKTGEICQTKI